MRPVPASSSLPAAASALLACLAIGCGSEPPSTPAACLGGADEYLAALDAAPGEVRLEGTTPISGCLVAEQEAGPLNSVGSAAVEAATRLNSRAVEDPGGDATVRLGYLVGAIQESASETGGIHTELVRRLDAAARFNPGDGALPAEFERAFGLGYAAGQRAG